MNIDSPIFVPRNNMPMASTLASGMSASKSPYALCTAPPPTSDKSLDNKNNVSGYWPAPNGASAYYRGGVDGNYLQYCQQRQELYLQHIFQRQRTLPSFHNQWTQSKAVNNAVGQRQRQQKQQHQQQRKPAPAQSQQIRKKQKTQQQPTKQHQLPELQHQQQQQLQQTDFTKCAQINGATKARNNLLSSKSTSATTLLLLHADVEIVTTIVGNADENVLCNIKSNNNNDGTDVTARADGDVNMPTHAPINNVTAALPNQSIQLADEPEEAAKKDDTVQRNGSRGGQQTRHPRYYQNQQQQQQQGGSNTQQHSKNDSSDSGISTNGRQQQQHNHPHQRQQQHQQQQQQQHNQKQRKTRSNSKRQDNNNTTTTAQKRATDYSVDDWLGREMVYCYDPRYISSCAEENLMAPRHNPAHRNSTSSDAAASDDLNSSSSNEDLSAVYTVMPQPDKKPGKARRNRQQRRRKRHDNQTADQLQAIPMDVDEDSKENRRPAQQHGQHQHQAQQQQPPKLASVNLRKQCTKAAALKAVNKHNNNNRNSDINSKSNNAAHALTNSPSNSSVCSALSSASSTFSLSSSASSSPTNSANCSPTASPNASKRSTENYRKIARTPAPPLRQQTKLNMPENELVQHLRRYITDPNLLRIYGYPVESAIHEGCIEIYKCVPRPTGVHYSTTKSGVLNTSDGLQVHYSAANSTTNTTTNTNVEAQWPLVDNSTDSGQGSGDSSPPSIDSDSSEAGDDEPVTTTACYTPDGSYQIFSQYDQSVEKQCVRCMSTFHVTETGEYLSYESCIFHWGKLQNCFTDNGFAMQYSCCMKSPESEGCTYNSLHVWTGAVFGINGPYTDFVHTRPRRGDKCTPTKVYALDCEMSFTGRGLELTKVTMVGYDGQLVYEHFVRPDVKIIDYNTRFSGVTEEDLCIHSNKGVKTLAEVQRDLLQIIDADTILIGHGLDNDLRVLRIVHKTIIDTSIAFPHTGGYPYRRALKHLTKTCLNRDIQCGNAGHSSFEDSRACLELMLWKVRKELRPTAY